ncbi:MAG: hypothetical protein KKE11_00765 [Gammaproteobacteria bacterium]|nr:hypothetical protein [Gammaproteobacteria bacterium]
MYKHSSSILLIFLFLLFAIPNISFGGPVQKVYLANNLKPFRILASFLRTMSIDEILHNLIVNENIIEIPANQTEDSTEDNHNQQTPPRLLLNYAGDGIEYVLIALDPIRAGEIITEFHETTIINSNNLDQRQNQTGVVHATVGNTLTNEVLITDSMAQYVPHLPELIDLRNYHFNNLSNSTIAIANSALLPPSSSPGNAVLIATTNINPFEPIGYNHGSVHTENNELRFFNNTGNIIPRENCIRFRRSVIIRNIESPTPYITSPVSNGELQLFMNEGPSSDYVYFTAPGGIEYEVSKTSLETAIKDDSCDNIIVFGKAVRRSKNSKNNSPIGDKKEEKQPEYKSWKEMRKNSKSK